MHKRQMLYIYTVFCEVTTLRKDGLRLRPDEWPEPVRGLLRVEQRDARYTSARRAQREIKVMGEWVTAPITLLFMFDPEFVEVAGDGFLLRGYVISGAAGRSYEHQQLWLVRPRPSGDGAPLPRFDPAPWIKQLPVDEQTGTESTSSERWLADNPGAKAWKR